MLEKIFKLPYFNLVLKGFFLNHWILNLCSHSIISNNFLPSALELLDLSKDLLFLIQWNALMLYAVLQATDLFHQAPWSLDHLKTPQASGQQSDLVWVGWDFLLTFFDKWDP